MPLPENSMTGTEEDDRRVVSIRHTLDEDEKEIVSEKLKEAFDELGYEINWVHKTMPEHVDHLEDGPELHLDWSDALIDLEEANG